MLKEEVLKVEPLKRAEFFRKEVKTRIFKTAIEIYDIAKARKIKHKYKIRMPRVEYIMDDPVLSINYAFYKAMLKEVNKENLIDKYQIDERIYNIDEMSEMSEYVFKQGHKDYEYLVGTATLFGWKEFKDYDAVREKLKNWLNNDKHPNYKGSAEKFYEIFRQKVAEIFRWRKGKLKSQISIDDFVKNIVNTSTSGSAYDPGGKRAEVIYNNEKEKMPNTKFGKSIALSEAERKERILRKEKQISSVSIKTEFYPKVRLIVSSGYNTFMKMKYVDTWMSKWMHGYERTTLSMKKTQLLKFWKTFARREGVNIPIDQSAFDHNVDKRMVLIMIDEIKNLIIERGINCEEEIRVTELLQYALDGGSVTYKDPTGKVMKMEYQSGIQSGWYWTAFLDTLANEAEYRTALHMVREYGIEVNELLFNAQGDDIALRVKTYLQASAIVCALRSMGFTIHPKKTFFSKNHNEYLRRYSKDNEINGYPARMVNNILWLYPGDVASNKLMEKLNGTTGIWRKFYERMKGKKQNMISKIRKDLKGQKVTEEIIHAYLSTDKVLGGAELEDGKQYLINTTKEKLIGKVEIDDIGYKEFHLRFGQDQSREMETWMLSALKFPDYIHHKKTHNEVKTEIKETGKIKALPYNLIKSETKPTTLRDEVWPVNVIFGQSKELLTRVFPNIDSFVEMGNAPKQWIYSYLAGHVKSITPYIHGMSEEFAGLVYHEYEAAIIQAMYKKKNTHNKWLRLNQWAQQNFSHYIHSQEDFPKMY